MKIKVYALHRRGPACWTWCHQRDHHGVEVEGESISMLGSAYGTLYASWEAAYKAALKHAGQCVLTPRWGARW